VEGEHDVKFDQGDTVDHELCKSTQYGRQVKNNSKLVDAPIKTRKTFLEQSF